MREIKFRAWDNYENKMYSHQKCKLNAWLPNSNSVPLYPKQHKKNTNIGLSLCNILD